jgi:hypothetical protein
MVGVVGTAEGPTPTPITAAAAEAEAAGATAGEAAGATAGATCPSFPFPSITILFLFYLLFEYFYIFLHTCNFSILMKSNHEYQDTVGFKPYHENYRSVRVLPKTGYSVHGYRCGVGKPDLEVPVLNPNEDEAEVICDVAVQHMQGW